MKSKEKTAAPAPGAHYQKELDREERPIPDFLREIRPDTTGPDTVPIEKYISRDYHEKEIEGVWKKTWQWACREEQIPEAGDTFVYDICGISIVLVRQRSGAIKAFRNVCLHRGRRLCDYNARVSELRCPFHGFAWKLDGDLKTVPTPWDLPHVEREKFSLPEVHVDTWAGFVFVNLDEDPSPLADTLDILPDHFARWDLQDRAIIADVSKIMRCNWKINKEGFLETWHVYATHPQLLASFGAFTSQFDVYDTVGRGMAPLMGDTPALANKPTEQERLNSLTYQYLAGAEGPPVPEGERARDYAATQGRAALKDSIGDKADEYCNSELMDTIAYSVFPNFLLFGGPGVRQMYRWRPYKNRHDMSVMDVVLLAPFDGERPEAAEHRTVGPDESWRVASELGGLALIEDQDATNLEAVQIGLEGASHDEVTLAKYQESLIRHFHRLLDEHVGAIERKTE
ncbi:MAG: aromatic ring-hydroxylating oxygenase subunit alpha [Parasphingopyxis sp.]|uniref:aromatic ring-hydroxylating oxygenase subunit alpha n=1 Tax=Parasphingopyxis sp. TaxID=1920299 RepID=UPI003FA10DAF